MQTFNQFLEQQITEGLGAFLGNALQKAGSYLTGTNNQNVEQKIKQYEDAIRNATKSFKDPYLQELIDLRLKSFAKDYASVMKHKMKQQQPQTQPQTKQQQPQTRPQRQPQVDNSSSTLNLNTILGR